MKYNTERAKKFLDLEKTYYNIVDKIILGTAILINPINKIKQSNNNKISITSDNVVDVMINNENSCVLIFASAKKPGGGVVNGAIAQEEDISLASTWYFQAKNAKDFYQEKHASALNTDKILYANGLILKDTYGHDIKPVDIKFLACAAPNINGLKNQGLQIKDEELYKEVAHRINKIIHTINDLKIKTCILGAFGCGVFGLSSEKVATIFRDEIKNLNINTNIIFSIKDIEMKKIFSDIILEQKLKLKI